MRKRAYKRTGALLLLGTMIIGMVGCGNEHPDNSATITPVIEHSEQNPIQNQDNGSNEVQVDKAESTVTQTPQEDPEQLKADPDNNPDKKQEDFKNNGIEQTTQDSLIIYSAEYPEMNPYPKNIGFGGDEAEYEAWAQSYNELKPESEGYKEDVWYFSRDTISKFLSETDGENKIYSPVNIYLALGMLSEVTDGESRQQILNLLHEEDVETLRKNVNDLWLAHYCDDGRFTSKLGASMWLNEDIGYKMETLQQVAETYRASAYQGEMGSERINTELQSWINEQTGSLLKDQAANVKLDKETILALVTTIYYQAKWEDTFNSYKTVKDTFYAPNGEKEHDFMHDSGSDYYYWSDNFSAVQKSFDVGGGMFFILPDEGVNVEDLLNDEQVMSLLENYNTWENKKYLTVNLSVPKFDATSDLSLSEELKELGITDVFGAAADFTPLAEDASGIFLSEVKHAARVKIDEEGCEAAAYTVAITFGSMLPPADEVDFIVDRPFLFVITGRDGLPLFIGVVNQP